MSRILVVFCAVALAWGCDAGGNSPAAIEPQPAPAYRSVANVKQMMEWILDPAADTIWDSAGFVITEEGETDLAPTTDEGWQRVRNGAAVVAEAGNLLMMPGRAGGADWVTYAQQLTDAGVAAMGAAKARDADALFDAGGQLYQVCRACHEQYMVPLEAARSSR